ncbi:MAG: hypothetical protein GYB36_10875 [Alphaproteobacteria bacterium]|nr:hypothetical protein [Alphaproteobacteria bacterium]
MWLISIAALAQALVSAEPGPDTLTAQEAQRDITIARRALESIHPGYERFTSRERLDAQWAAFEAASSQGMERRQFYLSLAELLGDIRCDHTKAELPQEWAETRNEVPVYLPFRFQVFDGRMYVEAPGDTGLERGTEILSLDGDPATSRLAAVLPFIAIDGYTDHTRWVTMMGSSEELGSGFDHYDPLLNPDDGQVEIRYRDLDGVIGTRVFDRLTYPEFSDLAGERRRRNFSDEDAIEVLYPEPGVASLAVSTFVNYRTPVDPMEVFAPIFEEIQARNVHTLIVDMRRNGGGSTDAQLGLLAHLSRDYIRPLQEVRVRTIEFGETRPYIDTWDPSALNPPAENFTQREDGWYSYTPQALPELGGFAAAPGAFQGRLILLVGSGNASGASQMIGALVDREDTYLIGEPTGGTQQGPTAGIIYFLDLPESGIRVRVPWQLAISSIEEPVIGYGFAPDIHAPLTRESWLANIDPALEAALELARQTVN